MSKGIEHIAVAISSLVSAEGKHDKFVELAREVTVGKNTPDEKILAIVEELDRRFAYLPDPAKGESLGPIPFDRGASIDVDDACVFVMALASHVGVTCRLIMARYEKRWTCFVGYLSKERTTADWRREWKVFDPLGQQDVDKADEWFFGPEAELR